MIKRVKSPYNFNQIRGIQKLDRLSYVLGEKQDFLIELAIQKDNYYKPFVDRKPGKKDRYIDQPTGELLAVQTKIRDRILDLAHLSMVTYGGVEGKGTTQNAQQHLRKNELVKLDLHDCFHSTKSRMIRRLFKNRFGYSKPIADLLTELCTYKGHVPVGSTLSSTLVNHVLNPVWEKIHSHCSNLELAFTTWVDDIAVSGKAPREEIGFIKDTINSYGFEISWHKKEILRNNGPQSVTGKGVNTNRITVPVKKRLEFAKVIKADPTSPSSQGKINYVISTNRSQGMQLDKLRQKLNKTNGVN